MNINIYLRSELEGDSVLIGTGNPDDFDALLKAVQHWGCAIEGDTTDSTAVGQFFVHGKKAGFEVIITSDDE